jgi:hypothetical protein
VALQAELDSPTGWMYPRRLTDELTVQTMNRELPAVHATRERLIEPQVRRALHRGGRVVDLGAHEGWFSMPAPEWGADSRIRSLRNLRRTSAKNLVCPP